MRAAGQIVVRLSENLTAIVQSVLAVGIACLAAGPATAQSATSILNVPPQAGAASVPALNAQRAALFKRMMANPADIDLAFEYASLSSRAGDLEAAVQSLVDQYEQIGPLNIRALEQEHELPLLHQTLEEARRYHREWLADVFAPNLARLAGSERERRLTALYAATDIYLWKLLRRDLKCSRRQTEDTFRRLASGVLA